MSKSPKFNFMIVGGGSFSFFVVKALYYMTLISSWTYFNCVASVMESILATSKENNFLVSDWFLTEMRVLTI